MYYDIVIIGAGTAGLTAAVYCARAHVSAAVIEQSGYGGQIISAAKVENYPGFGSISGIDFATALYEQATSLGVTVIPAVAVGIEADGAEKTVRLSSGEDISCKAVIIANGSSHRRLGCPGEKEFEGRGVSYCATCDGALYRDKDVAVIGGSEHAVNDAAFLSNICKTVYIVQRKNAFSADEETVNRLLAAGNVRAVLGASVRKIEGDTQVRRIIIEDTHTKEQSELAVGGVFVAVGQSPDNAVFGNVAHIDERGYITAGEDCATGTPGIYAAGDTRAKALRQLVTAAADGATAATNAGAYIRGLR